MTDNVFVAGIEGAGLASGLEGRWGVIHTIARGCRLPSGRDLITPYDAFCSRQSSWVGMCTPAAKS
ncbi:hypothetical protein AB0B25_04005 [Nocardia sp. NPDC049190]|uniref:hypothetical protein n=1 Tax=Nocardia sp. NPDC049190 TaxID=3155650 RepID=UPI0033E5E517